MDAKQRDRVAIVITLAICLGVGVVLAGIEGQENKSEPPSDIKRWQADAPLEWADFQGAAPNSPFAAQSVWTWQNQTQVLVTCAQAQPWHCVAGFERSLVQAVFLKSFSWVKPFAAASQILLVHEQGHFDLAQVYAKRLTGALLALSTEAQSDNRLEAEANAFRALEALVDETVASFTEQSQQAQDRYERETNHGTDRSQQQRWQADIQAMLRAAI